MALIIMSPVFAVDPTIIKIPGKYKRFQIEISQFITRNNLIFFRNEKINLSNNDLTIFIINFQSNIQNHVQ